MKKINAWVISLLISLVGSTPALGSEWKTLGVEKKHGGCVSHQKECIASVETRYGEVSFVTTEQGKFKLLIRKKEVAQLEGYSVTIQEKFSIERKDIVLVALNSGGMSCPMELYIVQVAGDAAYKVSESFGSCSDYYRAYVSKGSLMVRMPSYFNPMHLEDLSKSDRNEVEQRKDAVFRWFDSKITEMPDKK